MKTKYSSIDPYFGPYDNEEDALKAMKEIGKDGRLVCIYTDKNKGITNVYVYNDKQKNLIPQTTVNNTQSYGDTEW